MARLLLITHIYPPAVDGGSKIIAQIGDYLKNHGHQTLVITSNCTSSDDFSLSRHNRLNYGQDAPNIIRLPVFTLFHRPLKLLAKIFPNLTLFSKGPIFKFFPLLSSLKSILSFRPDYIIAGPLPTTIIIYAIFFRRLTKLLLNYSPKLLTIPCFHPQDPDFKVPLLISALNQSDHLWCLTNYEKKYLQTKLNITSPKYYVHGLGVEASFIIKKENIKYPKNPRLLFIANFSAHKRTELLIQAFNLILNKYPHTSLTLLGQKTLYFPQITAFLKKISPQSRKKIKFVFSPTRSLIKKSIDSATCLILPSIHESFGLVFVESLARAKAVVGANTPQTSEVIKTLGGGLTFDSDNLDSLHKTIRKLLDSKSLSQKLATKGYQTVKKYYTWDKIGESLCKKLDI
ncbi:MAG: Glycosyl transferase, group 1 [Candidatus Shapirobacteria bacterium GW2011_GWE1_38_10]|uniref:Glycosyl transferase, group 1 n=1 Tax=Candidatus Shapirobacteria bacterium GW2011_GWE1_38_10 TaxID=1618488 RepID=A0A0G0KLK2_9BACT|nr:MAG: Glycosyl transferase, group 1 [Candidatus Shapirobacteria bacterium GW2011_GWF2_37_20]KKQ50064.1 MAG: Glycosyl transferase, group 1 [Candidatus Shapirobacteria bacterium GW2011_GWE1_38_10]HBP51136.1 hypothetical protein [Candidatus Shapirobacteria bacterium]